jgi:hypothetical protein
LPFVSRRTQQQSSQFCWHEGINNIVDKLPTPALGNAPLSRVEINVDEPVKGHRFKSYRRIILDINSSPLEGTTIEGNCPVKRVCDVMARFFSPVDKSFPLTFCFIHVQPLLLDTNALGE